MNRPKTYISVCKQQIAMNRKLPHEKQIGPLRLSSGKHGKPQRVWGYGCGNAAYVAVIYDPSNPMPWGARAWIQITHKPVTAKPSRKGRTKHELPQRRNRRKNS